MLDDEDVYEDDDDLSDLDEHDFNDFDDDDLDPEDLEDFSEEFDDEDDYDEGHAHYGHNDDEFDDDGDFHHDYEPLYSSGDHEPISLDYQYDTYYGICFPFPLDWGATTHRTFKQVIEYLNEIRAAGGVPPLADKEIATLYDAFVGSPEVKFKGTDIYIKTKYSMSYNSPNYEREMLRVSGSYNDDGNGSYNNYDPKKNLTEWGESQWKDYGAVPVFEMEYKYGDTLEEHLAVLYSLDSMEDYNRDRYEIDVELETAIWNGDIDSLREDVDSKELTYYDIASLPVELMKRTPALKEKTTGGQ